MTELGPPLDITDIDIIMAMFPTSRLEVECVFILGTYVELVDREVISKQKDLLLNTLLGTLRVKTECVRSRAVPQIQLLV